jgi:Leu/Phe-tRNA-protein transferase
MSVYLFWIIIFLQEQYLNYSRLIYSEGNQNEIYDQMFFLVIKTFHNLWVSCNYQHHNMGFFLFYSKIKKSSWLIWLRIPSIIFIVSNQFIWSSHLTHIFNQRKFFIFLVNIFNKTCLDNCEKRGKDYFWCTQKFTKVYFNMF